MTACARIFHLMLMSSKNQANNSSKIQLRPMLLDALYLAGFLPTLSVYVQIIMLIIYFLDVIISTADIIILIIIIIIIIHCYCHPKLQIKFNLVHPILVF